MLVGFEINLVKLKKSMGDSVNIALFSIVISFMMGFFLMYLLDYNFLVSIIVGVCFSLSAEATNINKKIIPKSDKNFISSGTVLLNTFVFIIGILINIPTNNCPIIRGYLSLNEISEKINDEIKQIVIISIPSI